MAGPGVIVKAFSLTELMPGLGKLPTAGARTVWIPWASFSLSVVSPCGVR